jgi:hypothetical protein
MWQNRTMVFLCPKRPWSGVKLFWFIHSKPKVGDITTFVGKRYNHKKVGILTIKNGSHTHKSG